MVYLSIIIPHYNSVRSLRRLLASIPNNKEVQTIVVDDCSDREVDEWTQLCSDSEYDHVLFLKNESEKKGAGACRNIGLGHATGKWLLFADADDFFVEGFYSTVKNYFFSDNDVVFFVPTSIETETGIQSDRHLIYEKILNDYLEQRNLASEVLVRYNFFVPWSKLMKRRLVTEHNIDFDEVIASNDVMFSTKVGYYMQTFSVSKQIIYCVTKSKGSLTTNTSLPVFESRLEAFIRYCRFLQARLNRKNLQLLPLNGRIMLINAIKNKLGFRKVMSTYFQLKKNKIHIFDFRFFNPIFVVHRLYFYIKHFHKEKRFSTNK